MFAYCNNPIMIGDPSGKMPDAQLIKLAKLNRRGKYSNGFGKSHKVPYYMSPLKDFGYVQDESIYTCQTVATFTKKLSSSQAKQIANNTRKDRQFNAIFDELTNVSTDIISSFLPSTIIDTIIDPINRAQRVGNLVNAFYGEIEITECCYTSTVAIYQNKMGEYAVVTKITSDSNSEYNIGWGIDFHYDTGRSLESYAFPSSAGVIMGQ